MVRSFFADADGALAPLTGTAIVDAASATPSPIAKCFAKRDFAFPLIM
jgi:hypothetical protein